jgi:uncharacterized protein YndB with AHSA1/START domain
MKIGHAEILTEANMKRLANALTLFVLACSGFACIPALAQIPEERRIVKEVVVKAAPEAVFKAWSTSEGVASFFAPEANIQARPDGLFEVYMNPYAQPGMKGADNMRVLGVQENRMITFTWNAPPHLPEARAQRTFVTVRMQPEGAETRVRLTHTGWGDGGEWDKAYAYFDRAWGNVLANLQKRFADGPIDWTEWRGKLKAMMEEEARKKAGK